MNFSGGTGGFTDRIILKCVLPLNMQNQKFYTFYYFWLWFLLLISMLMVLLRIACVVSTELRELNLKRFYDRKISSRKLDWINTKHPMETGSLWPSWWRIWMLWWIMNFLNCWEIKMSITKLNNFHFFRIIILMCILQSCKCTICFWTSLNKWKHLEIKLLLIKLRLLPLR